MKTESALELWARVQENTAKAQASLARAKKVNLVMMLAELNLSLLVIALLSFLVDPIASLAGLLLIPPIVLNHNRVMRKRMNHVDRFIYIATEAQKDLVERAEGSA